MQKKHVIFIKKNWMEIGFLNQLDFFEMIFLKVISVYILDLEYVYFVIGLN